jgi:hypothetical protein
MKKEMKSAAKVKKCSLCSKPAWETSSFCQKHYEDNDGPNKVLRLTEMEALKFGKMDAEIRNCLQGIQLSEYEMNRIRMDSQMKLEAQIQIRTKLSDRLSGLRREYEPFVRDLAQTYGIQDPNKMSIDPDTGIIRDLSNPLPT